MIQVINDPYRNRDYSAIKKYDRATPYITGVSSILQGLIEGKTKELANKRQREETASGLQHLLNISAKEAHHLSSLRPEILDHVVKDRLNQQKKSDVHKQRVGGLQSLFNFSPEQAEEIAPLLDNQEGLAQLLGQGQSNQQQAPLEIVPKPAPELPQTQQPMMQQAAAQNQPQLPLQEAIREDIQKQRVPAEQNVPTPVAAQQMIPKKPVAPEVVEQEEEVIPERKLTASEHKQVQKEKKILDHEQRKQLQKEEAVAQKETQKYYDQVLSVDKAAKESDARLDRMIKLVNEGSLPFSAYYSGLKNLEEHVAPTTAAGAGGAIGTVLGGLAGAGATVGIGAAPAAVIGGAIGTAIGGLISPVVGVLRSIQRLTSPDTEEFEKLSAQFISGAKAIFGSRITDQDLKAFMSQIPTLSNTDAGKKKIIRSMKIANEAEHVRAKAMKEIIKENDGRRPANLPILVEERAQPELDMLAEKFVGESKPKAIKKEVSQERSLGGARSIRPIGL